ncbi:riboflavin kinase [Rickenella mellea]|uniref:Riboflavin kinase n=1 Tax=Rickenella mellea TaxID=50990 RepID=A0A4R5XFF8_9AGAM|nr:riboflavin kinase [Rickenella mellea]
MSKTADQLASQPARPPAPLQTESFRNSRTEIVGGDTPEPPFPIIMSGVVQKGFGRGGKDLGCPTANLPDESLLPMSSVTSTGVYFGYAQVLPKTENKALLGEHLKVWPMVMSMGFNPFYSNKELSAEVHIMHDYGTDFYGHEMKVVVLGYIRPELDYTSREALILDIDMDKRVAIRSLDRPAYEKYSTAIPDVLNA